MQRLNPSTNQRLKLKNDIYHDISPYHSVFLECGRKTSAIENINGMVIYFNYKLPKGGKSFG